MCYPMKEPEIYRDEFRKLMRAYAAFQMATALVIASKGAGVANAGIVVFLFAISPTWRIGPAFQLFSRHKLLIFRGGVPRKVSKPAVVKTPPVPKSAPMCIIDSCYVPALHDAKEKRQRAPLLQFSRRPSGERRASASTARVLSGRDQRPPARSLAQNH